MIDGQDFNEMPGELVETISADVVLNDLVVFKSGRPCPWDAILIKECILDRMGNDVVTKLSMRGMRGSSRKINEFIKLMASVLAESRHQIEFLQFNIMPHKQLVALDRPTFELFASQCT